MRPICYNIIRSGAVFCLNPIIAKPAKAGGAKPRARGGCLAAEITMKERFHALCYMLLSAVAAFAAAVFLFPAREIMILSAGNLFVTAFIYYNYTSLSTRPGRRLFPAGRFLPGLWRGYRPGKIMILENKPETGEKAAFAGRGLLLLALAVAALAAAPAARGASSGTAGGSVSEKIAALQGEKEISGRERLYRELGEARDKAATAVLSRAALSDAEPGARIDAILALSKIGGPEALKGLLAVLAREKHKGVRIQAVNALGFFSAPEALAGLRGIARNDPDKDLRISAVMALSRLNDTQVLSDNFAVETDTSVKLGIIDALGRSDGGEKELKKIRAKNKDAKTNERLDFYTGEKRKKAKKK